MDRLDPAHGNGEQEKIPEGTLIAGRYRILKTLGSGGMGSVYLAADRVLGDEKIAIKILHTGFVHDETQLARFRREVQLMRKVNHKNVVRTYDVGVDREFTYFTMEFVPGVQLEKLISERAIGKDKVINYMLQIAEALQAIHTANIIHRDLKPGNILILDDGTLRITDFGVARPEISNLTAHDEIVGSVCYIAPEIWLGKKITPAADLYALGVILYEMLTGKVPFDGESPAVLMRAHLDRAPIPPKSVNPSVPNWLNKLALKLLAKSSSDRPRDAKEIIEYIKLHGEEHGGADSGGQAVQFMEELETKSRVLTKTSDPGTPANLTGSQTQLNVIKRVVSASGSSGNLPTYRAPGGTFREVRDRLAQSVLLLGGLVLLSSALQFAFGRVFPQFSAQLTDTQLIEQASSFAAFGFMPALGLLLPHILLFVFQLSIPAVLIGTAAGSNTQAVRTMLIAFGILLAGFFGLAAYFLIGAPSREHVTALSLLSATATAKDLVSSVAFLSPVTNVYEQVILGNGLVQSATGVTPLFSSPLVLGCFIVYASFLAYAVHRCGKEFRGESSAIPGGIILFLAAAVHVEGIFFRGSFPLEPWTEYGQFSLRIPHEALLIGLVHWGIVFFFAFLTARRSAPRKRGRTRTRH